MTRRFTARGHLIDSGIMMKIFNLLVTEGADYTVTDFRIGKKNTEESSMQIDVSTDSEEKMELITNQLVRLGGYELRPEEAVFKSAEKDACVPEDFYSSTNHRTEVFSEAEWKQVDKQRMDAVIVRSNDRLECRKLRDVKSGDPVLCGSDAVRVFPPFRDREGSIFSFMSNEVSSERSVDVWVKIISDELKAMRESGKKVVFVAGPVLIHSGGGAAFSSLIRKGYVGGLLSGNALAVHDLESVFFGTSLGIELTTGMPSFEGHKNHMRAINRINHYGSIRAAIEEGALEEGIMYEIEKADIPYCLAGSIRDDGPLPETESDIIKAQNRYSEIIRGASMVVMLSSMLHSIGTGNMLPSWVKTVCVDINPAVVTKLSDRGSSQAIGIVSDLGLFIRALDASS